MKIVNLMSPEEGCEKRRRCVPYRFRPFIRNWSTPINQINDQNIKEMKRVIPSHEKTTTAGCKDVFAAVKKYSVCSCVCVREARVREETRQF